MFLYILICYFNSAYAESKSIYFIRFSDKAITEENTKSVLPKNVTLTHLSKNYGLIETEKKLTRKELDELRRNPEISSVVKNQKIKKQKDLIVCYKGEEVLFEDVPFRNLLSLVSRYTPYPRNSCISQIRPTMNTAKMEYSFPLIIEETNKKRVEKKFYTHYSQYPIEMAHEQMDLLSMPKEFNHLKYTKENDVKVAVLDSGITKASLEQMKREVKRKSYIRDVNPKSDDIDDHGSKVISIFSSKHHGASFNSDITSIKITKGSSEYAVSNAFKLFSIQKACDEGNRVINVSYEAVYEDENDFVDHTFFEDLKKKGCLLFNSAGNPGNRHAKPDVLKEDNGAIFVASQDLSGRLGSGYARGEVKAPGINIPLIDKEGEKTIGDGSSYASPLAAALTARVLGYLQTKDKFKNLSPEEQVILLERMLKASAREGSVSGARMGNIALKWLNDQSAVGVPGIEELKRLLPENCDNKYKSCLFIENCTEVALCLKKNKVKAVNCRNYPAKEMVIDQIKTYIKHGLFEHAIMAVSYLPEGERDEALGKLEDYLSSKAPRVISRVSTSINRKNEIERFDKLSKSASEFQESFEKKKSFEDYFNSYRMIFNKDILSLNSEIKDIEDQISKLWRIFDRNEIKTLKDRMSRLSQQRHLKQQNLRNLDNRERIYGQVSSDPKLKQKLILRTFQDLNKKNVYNPSYYFEGEDLIKLIFKTPRPSLDNISNHLVSKKKQYDDRMNVLSSEQESSNLPQKEFLELPDL